MRRTWAVLAATVMTTVLGARASPAQSPPPAPAGSGAVAPAPVPTVAGNTVVIPLPSASATVAGPSATVAAPPTMMMVPQPAGVASGQVPSGYMMLVPWVPPTAAPTAPTPVTEPAVTERSYAYKLVIADLSALGLLLLAAPTKSGELAGAGVGVYALGAPVMHLTEGNVAKGAASLGLRLGMPIGGFYVGAGGCLLVTSSRNGSGLDDLVGCLLLGFVTGGAGLVGAVAIDYAILGKEKVPVAQPRSVSWAPTFRPTKDGMTLGVVGAW